MKKILILIMALMVAIQLKASYSFQAGDIWYAVTGDNTTCEVSSVVDYVETVVIPEEVSYTVPVPVVGPPSAARVATFWEPGKTYTFKVTAIGNQAIKGNPYIKSIVIPETIVNIGAGAFEECTSLESVAIPSSIKELRFNFNNCTGLKNVTVGGGVESIIGSFQNCGGLEEVCFEGDEKEIGFASSPFYQTEIKNVYQNRNIRGGDIFSNKGVQKVELGDMVTFVGGYDNNPITEIIFGKNVTEIETQAFKHCVELKYLVIPESIESIGHGSFNDCTGLEYIYIPSNIRELSPNFNNCTGLKKVTVGGGVESIIASFQNCGSLEEVCFEEGEREIGFSSSPFYQTEIKNVYQNRNIRGGVLFSNKGIQKVELGDMVTFVGGYDNNPITEIIFGKNVTEIEPQAFKHCVELKDLVIAENIETIGHGSFSECTGLEYIYIPSNIRELSSNFNDCTGLKKVTIGGGVESIIASFQNCGSLEEVCFEGGEREIGFSSSPFYQTEIKNVYQNRNISTNYVFSDKGIRKLVLGDLVTYVQGYDNNPITEIEFGKGLESVRSGAFSGCDEIVSIHAECDGVPVCENDGVFSRSAYDSAMLLVPRGRYGEYAEAAVWRLFKSIVQDSSVVNFNYVPQECVLTVPEGFDGLVGYGEELTFSVDPVEGYLLGNVTFDGAYDKAQGDDAGTWTVSGIRSDLTVNIPTEAIYFTAKAHIDSSAGHVVLNGVEADSVRVRYGEPLEVVVRLNEGRRLVSASVNGVETPVTDGVIRVEKVLSDVEIAVGTSLVSYVFKIDYDNACGSVIVGGNTASEQSYDFGARPEIEIIPEEGYKLESAKLNGLDITGRFVNNTYQVDSIKSDMTLTVSFKVATVGLSILGLEGGRLTTINKYGATVSILIAPDAGWKVNTVTFNGNIVEASEIVDGVFTTPELREDAEIGVTFVRDVQTEEGAPLTADNVRVYGRNHTIYIDGAEDDAVATVNDVAGHTVYSGLDREISVYGGVYIVTVGGRTYKLML